MRAAVTPISQSLSERRGQARSLLARRPWPNSHVSRLSNETRALFHFLACRSANTTPCMLMLPSRSGRLRRGQVTHVEECQKGCHTRCEVIKYMMHVFSTEASAALSLLIAHYFHVTFLIQKLVIKLQIYRAVVCWLSTQPGNAIEIHWRAPCIESCLLHDS